MKVALGTFEVSEEDRKAIKKSLGYRGGKSSRSETKDFLNEAMQKALAELQSSPTSASPVTVEPETGEVPESLLGVATPENNEE